ncbi:hypothetical protein MYAER_3844 [Microcystis aeruginosa NIES-2549]|uniref:Uncharacterized protein n=1 Tax=Microcystis aeruginosa NIES-2549 TaxID=1641812 RepID=A0A0F6U710_MICAE|nr:hypothetical protein [Microcystis aeruginosa]AKE66174.1 hypothetical protein MYAER_3844 [Microcystis aeruginosa NIES-2549]AOC54584.1 hypothetical protein amyaer_3891 [Microcystis aeruginosa NIES-2481]
MRHKDISVQTRENLSQLSPLLSLTKKCQFLERHERELILEGFLLFLLSI